MVIWNMVDALAGIKALHHSQGLCDKEGKQTPGWCQLAEFLKSRSLSIKFLQKSNDEMGVIIKIRFM